MRLRHDEIQAIIDRMANVEPEPRCRQHERSVVEPVDPDRVEPATEAWQRPVIAVDAITGRKDRRACAYCANLAGNCWTIVSASGSAIICMCDAAVRTAV